jgi:hypothetical protein
MHEINITQILQEGSYFRFQATRSTLAGPNFYSYWQGL